MVNGCTEDDMVALERMLEQASIGCEAPSELLVSSLCAWTEDLHAAARLLKG